MILIKNGRLMDPATGINDYRDLLIDDGRIMKIGFCGTLDDMANESLLYRDSSDNPESSGLTVIDASGMIVAPGLVDTHVHFRDPGFTDKEDIMTGALAAEKGGFTTVVMMGNTNPHMDNTDTLKYALEKGAETGINVYVCGNITKNMEGRELTDMDQLLEAGAVLFTDDGKPITDEAVMMAACKEAVRIGKVLSLHEENPEFIKENGVNTGEAAKALGITGSDREAEISMVKRDIAIAEETGASITVQHISTKEAVELIRKARQKNKNIHAEATPHHFTLTDEAVGKYGTMAKMNPPLRKEEDRQGIIRGLCDGTIEVIATDHAPHTKAEKAQEFSKAPSGIIGLETSLGLGIRELVLTGYMDMMTLLSRMTVLPAQIYDLPAGRIYEGGSADLVLFSGNESWKVDKFCSKAENSPFVGEELPGKVCYTICRGDIVYTAE